jgi:hypothetical protein
VIVVVLAIVLCAGIGVAATNVARSTAARDRARQRVVEAELLTQRLNAERAARAAAIAALVKSVAFFPRAGAVDVAPNAQIVVFGTAGRLTAVRVTGPTVCAARCNVSFAPNATELLCYAATNCR